MNAARAAAFESLEIKLNLFLSRSNNPDQQPERPHKMMDYQDQATNQLLERFNDAH